ncbi:MAG: hypothetical protein PHV37_06265 [Candidatus Gastranaerophilales bacterium]|nr:hypothetical protein [Candidatus Gastranaerophilales bacterium]
MRFRFSLGLSLLLLFLFSIHLPAFSYIFFKKSQPNAYYYDNPVPQNDVKKNLKKSAKSAKKKLKKIKLYNKKGTFENIQNKAPLTKEQYEVLAKDIKRADIKIPQPKFEKDDKLIQIQDPRLRIVRYNKPAGAKEININEVIKNRKASTIAVLSPDETKLVYSSAYFYPSNAQITSELYMLIADPDRSMVDKMLYASEIYRGKRILIASGLDELEYISSKTLTLIDWAPDSKRIAVKEKIGSTAEGIWQTNLWVYDFEAGQAKKLNAVREAIKYWWKTNENLDLVDFMWDIYPIGWDANNPERIVVYAYAYTTSEPKFLGTWSIDWRGERSQLMSLHATDFTIANGGYCLKAVGRD